MTLFHIGGTQVRLHPALLLVLAGAYVLGMLGALLLGALALCVHEWCHALVAHALGYRVGSVELLPFGGVARLAGASIAPRAEFTIAMAGPVCSMAVAAACGLLLLALPIHSPVLQQFMQLNLFLALFNLLPALPLDGGRMLRALLMRFLRPGLAARIAAWGGVLLGAVLLGACLCALWEGLFYPMPAVMGLFLVLAAIRELRQTPQAGLTAMLRRQDALTHGQCLPLLYAAVPAGMRAADALCRLSAGRYTVLRVVGADMRTLGELDEGTLLAGVARYGMDVTVEALL